MRAAESELVYSIMVGAYGHAKDRASIKTCWGESGGFMETRLLSEKVSKI